VRVAVSAGLGHPARAVRAKQATLVEEKVRLFLVDLAQKVPVSRTELSLEGFYDLLHGRSVFGWLGHPLVESVQACVLNHISD
jgi:hypothetical protein